MEKLSRQERADLRNRYRDDKLYKAWSHPLMELETELEQPSPEEIWHMTEKLHVRLRELGDDAPYEIDYVFRDLYEPLIGGDVTRGDAMFTAAVVSTVLLSQLCEAKEKETNVNPNRPICRALARILTKDHFLPVCVTLMRMLSDEMFDYNGEKVILPVHNYLDEAQTTNVLAASTLKEIDHWVEVVYEKTKGLSAMLTEGYTIEEYKTIWSKILALPDMLTRIKDISPNKNKWGFNLKMVANVIGMMLLADVLENNATQATTLIGASNARNYIRNHADYRPHGSGSVFTEEEHRMVMKAVKSFCVDES